MKTERAIELLKRISDSQFDGEYGDERREALSMAVRALEGDGDTIYRQDVLKILSSKNAAWDAYDKVKQLPSVQPVNYGSTKSDSSSQLKLNNDLISRRQAIGALNDEYHGMISDESMKIYQIINWISALPSAQPERKKGHWIEKEHSPFYCSVCGTYQYSASWEIKNKEYNFCPRCGADMRGEDDG